MSGIVRCALGVLAQLGPVRPGVGPVLLAIHACVERRLRRFERLMARLRAGRPAVKRQKGGARAKRAGGRRVSLVPRGEAWAVKMAQGTAVFGTQLQALLSEPGAAELLRWLPEAAAMLRPLCRMLAMPMLEATLQLPEPAPKPLKQVVRRAGYPGAEPWPGFRRKRGVLEALCLELAVRRVRTRGPPG